MAMSPEELFFKLSKLHRILIVVAVAALILVAWVLLVSKGQWEEINDLQAQIADINNKIRGQENVKKEGPVLEKRIQALVEERERYVKSLPDKQDIEALLKTITDLLAESNLVSQRFVPQREIVNEEHLYATIPIQLSVRGDYQKQWAFLTNLNALPRIVNVPQIRLNKSGGLTGRESDIAKKLDLISLDADIQGETYRQLSDQEKQVIAQKKAKQQQPPAKKK